MSRVRATRNSRINAYVNSTTGLPGLDAVSREAVGTFTAPGIINWKRSNTTKIRAAVMGAASLDLRSRWIFAADSMFAGTGANNNGTVDARVKSWPRQLAALLNAAGIQAYDTWACGNGVNGGNLATYLAYDPRMAFGSAGTLQSTWNGFAGPSWQLAADAVNGSVTLTPQISFDTADLVYGRGASTGTFVLQDQAAVQAGADIVSFSGSTAVAEVSRTFPANSTAVKALYKAVGIGLIGGIGVRNAAAPGIEIINAGISGVESSFFTATDGNSWMAHRASLAVMFQATTKNVYVMSGGYNDINVSGASIETVKSRMRTRINHLLALANPPDIIGIDYPKVGTTTEAAQIALNEAIRSVFVDEYDLPFVSQYMITETAAVAQTLDLMTSDALHNRAAGHAVTARLFLQGLQFAAGMSSSM